MKRMTSLRAALNYTHVCGAQILPGKDNVRLIVAERNGEAKRVGVYIAVGDIVDLGVDSCVGLMENLEHRDIRVS